MKRSLYQCFNAKTGPAKIYCDAGYRLSKRNDKAISMLKLERGDPLEIDICQDCPDYDEMGGSVEKEDRGWRYVSKKGED